MVDTHWTAIAEQWSPTVLHLSWPLPILFAVPGICLRAHLQAYGVEAVARQVVVLANLGLKFLPSFRPGRELRELGPL